MLKFTGKGRGLLPGVPARDLTDDEVKQYGKDRLLKSGLYEEAKQPRRKFMKEPEQEQAEE